MYKHDYVHLQPTSGPSQPGRSQAGRFTPAPTASFNLEGPTANPNGPTGKMQITPHKIDDK